MTSVLFLCSGNYYRSRFAEIYFNHLATTAGRLHRAESRGFRLHPGNIGPISPHALQGLERLRVPPPEPLRLPLVADENDLQRAAHVVAVKQAEHRPLMQRHFPAWIERVEYWHIDDVDVASPLDALPQLVAQVDALFARLAPAP